MSNNKIAYVNPDRKQNNLQKKRIKKGKLCIAAMLLLVICMLTACESRQEYYSISASDESDLITISFPESFEGLSGMDEDKLLEYLENNGEGNYENLTITDGEVQISVTEEQEAYWKKFAKDLAEAQGLTLTDVSPKYKTVYNDSFDEINVYYDTAISFKEAFNYVGKAAIDCALYQIFDGKSDYTITLNIYNIDTEKLVAGGNLDTGDVSYDDADWEKSYTLNAEEATVLESEYNDGQLISIKSSFVGGMNVINILQAATGNEYQYIYIDSEGSVQLRVDNDQKNTMIENMNQYLDSVSDQFKTLGNGYEISWNPDFSSISYQFDAALNKQDQANYFTYVETIGMINQLLNGDGNSYYIDLYIYDSSSGALVSEGNTKDGISWNIGE